MSALSWSFNQWQKKWITWSPVFLSFKVCVWWQKGAKWVGTWSLQVLSKVSRNVQPSKKGPDHGRGENVSTKSINRHYVVAFFYLSVKFYLNGSNLIRFYSVFFSLPHVLQSCQSRKNCNLKLLYVYVFVFFNESLISNTWTKKKR